MIVEPRTAGDPMQEDLYWTHLSQAEIAQELTGMGTPVSQPTVKQILDDRSLPDLLLEVQSD